MVSSSRRSHCLRVRRLGNAFCRRSQISPRSRFCVDTPLTCVNESHAKGHPALSWHPDHAIWSACCCRGMARAGEVCSAQQGVEIAALGQGCIVITAAPQHFSGPASGCGWTTPPTESAQGNRAHVRALCAAACGRPPPTGQLGGAGSCAGAAAGARCRLPWLQSHESPCHSLQLAPEWAPALPDPTAGQNISHQLPADIT